MSLVLLGTDACHLCDDAQKILLSLDGQLPCDVFLDDIASSETLVERYGLRIPVLLFEPGGQELDWPFDRQDVLTFVHQVMNTSESAE